MKTIKIIPSSFRDPSGVLFNYDNSIYRQVNLSYRADYEYLKDSGLYEKLIDNNLLISHDEVDIRYAISDMAYKVIQPEEISFISYPYEWSFSQLKDAALTTLKIQKIALDFGMSLKDSSAYNIQFRNGKPIFIDTLSFENYRQGQPWIAYKQFCQHFLVPLALMSYRDIRFNQLLRIYLDGIPLDLGNMLLPFHARLKLSLFSHIYLHAKSQKYFADKTINTTGYKMSRLSFLGLIDNLESAVKKLTWQREGTEWVDYYKDTSYSLDAFQHKKEIVSEFLDKIKPMNVWDLGANVGIFSRIANSKGIQTVSFDSDPAAVEMNYLKCIQENASNILPLLLDLTNPSPNIGWQNQERLSFIERGPADTVFALALIHHLVIGNNLPLNKIAFFLSRICRFLIIEFVPKNDSQVQKLLSTREDIFPNYKKETFEAEFSEYFTIQSFVNIVESERTLYLMSRK